MFIHSGFTLRSPSSLAVSSAKIASLLTVMNDILDFSKVEAGMLDLDPIDFNLHHTVEEIVGMPAFRAADNAVNRGVASRLLRNQGHTGALACNGHEALAALDRESFDFLFMDVQMPGMDGLEATARIRARETSGETHLRIVALTADAHSGDPDPSHGRNAACVARRKLIFHTKAPRSTMANPALRSNSKTPISGASTLLLALLAALGTCTLHAQTPLLTPPPVDSSVTAYIPLTGAERLHRYFHETFLSPGLYIAALGAAGGGQLFNDPPEWGQGTAGYAHRSASLLGLFATHVAIHQAGAAALGYDPRYTHCACKGFFHRSGHAILWSFITRNNEGSLRPDLPVVAAAYGSSMLSMYWYPARFSPLTDGVRLGTQQVGSEVGLNWFREFEPEIRKLLRLKP